MDYNFSEIEQRWQKFWAENKTFRADNKSDKPKYYVLDMFPYPSGAGLHVGHPLGYIASDIMARYKRHKGFNVLHPMGYDSFGLPAEQYAIQTGQHPAITTKLNIARYREQLDKIGFSFDWEREVQTSDPNYYKWTQWIFIQLFNSWYNKSSNKAEHIDTLMAEFEKTGNANVNAVCDEETPDFSEEQWKNFSEKEKSDALMHYRIAYLGEAYVNWCPALGTVLANDEVKDGVSERGGHPVERKLMKQWSMRITAYAQRLLDGLETIDWTDSLKESQRYWIGRSEGTSLKFKVQSQKYEVEVFTTRPDTIFGVSFVTLAPEHELVEKITTPEQKAAVDNYVTKSKSRSERERQAEVTKVSGVFTGAYVEHPFTGKQIPIWIGDYVLAGYGTGAVMAVPGHDSRDYAFAKHFDLPIIEVVAGGDLSKESYDAKEGKLINSDFLNGLEVKEALKTAIAEIEKRGLGKGKINYRLRDAVFGRQRYWGEPIPIYYKNGIPHSLPENELPLVLPEVDKFLPTEDGEPPLARAKNWAYRPHPSPPLGGGSESESNTSQSSVDRTKPRWQTAADSGWKEMKERAKELRKNQTDAEVALWEQLKNNQLGFKFRRQQVIGFNIVDFVCLDKKLVIEVDGEIHNYQKEYDAARTLELEKAGYKVIRFENNQIFTQIENVVAEIGQQLQVLPAGEDLGGAYPLETTTMPGWAGSSWYYLRYMDAKNPNSFADKKLMKYWESVDLYIGGSEHATGHLLYVRFWTKFLKDMGYLTIEEPMKKLINQGMIQGVSQYTKEINLDPKIKHAFDMSQKDKELHIFENETLIKSIKIEGRKKLDGYAIYCNFNCKLNFRFFDPLNKEYLATIVRSGPPATADFVIEKVHNSKVYSSHTLLDRWLKAEPHYRPIVITDLPSNAYWSYKNKNWKKFDDSEIDQNIPIWATKSEVEKMSKSKLNVVGPDNQEYYPKSDKDIASIGYYFSEEESKFEIPGIINAFGADTLRLYEMFLGPLEQSKPWNTNGITGVSGFLKKLWRLFYQNNALTISDAEPTKAELKTLHKTIKKITEDIERFSFNTSVSNFMICVNELTEQKCNKRAILEPLLICLSPYAPHITEELWNKLGHTESIALASFPIHNEAYLVEDSFTYPISFNGKMRFNIELPATLTVPEIEKEVMSLEEVKKQLNGASPKKIIIVPKKIVNIVV